MLWYNTFSCLARCHKKYQVNTHFMSGSLFEFISYTLNDTQCIRFTIVPKPELQDINCLISWEFSKDIFHLKLKKICTMKALDFEKNHLEYRNRN